MMWTNQKARYNGAGKGGVIYEDFTDFTIDEIMQHLGLYILNGINPCPRVEMKLKSATTDPTNGSNLCFESFGLNAERRHRHFKCFFATCDPNKPTPARETHPNWKVQPMLRHLLHMSKHAMILGRHVSCDEQTTSSKGNHPDIIRINFKKEGDVFQCDATCADGHTFCFYFRNQAAPKKWTEIGLSPLHARVLGLYEQLPGKACACGMENLYNSANFFK